MCYLLQKSKFKKTGLPKLTGIQKFVVYIRFNLSLVCMAPVNNGFFLLTMVSSKPHWVLNEGWEKFSFDLAVLALSWPSSSLKVSSTLVLSLS